MELVHSELADEFWRSLNSPMHSRYYYRHTYMMLPEDIFYGESEIIAWAKSLHKDTDSLSKLFEVHGEYCGEIENIWVEDVYVALGRTRCILEIYCVPWIKLSELADLHKINIYYKGDFNDFKNPTRDRTLSGQDRI